MPKDLVIVESPAKARTIGRFLGKNFVATASMGHVRDLPKRKTGVDVDAGFEPTYTLLPDKRKVVNELKKAAQNAENVYLATDPDREGEAIAWHLIEAAKIDKIKIQRVVFHEITQTAVKDAFQHPRALNQHLIDAQQARRVLDRVVGYDLSPVLWKKVRRGLSAGRVQSVTLRLIVDREREISKFVTEEFWTIDATLTRKSMNESSDASFKSRLRTVQGHNGLLKISNEQDAKKLVTDLESASYRVASVSKKEQHRKPSPPFITSSLQQEAFRKLGYTTRRTMVIAQQLYEGVQLGDEGPIGLITYMRTDSTNVATSALDETKRYIKEKFGPNYAPSASRRYTKRVKGAQEAHEAIRPTSVFRDPTLLKPYLNSEQLRLYELVWKRMLASQMSDAILDSTTLNIDATGGESSKIYNLRSVGSVLRFPGFRRLYLESRDDGHDLSEDDEKTLPDLNEKEELHPVAVTSEQRFTQPPSRYTEATLVKTLEEKGIGRPSTYAPTLATVMARDYAKKERRRFVPTKLGNAVSNLLTSHFPDIMDVGFTAKIEAQLDDIANGECEWTPVLKDFYGPFASSVERALVEAERVPRNEIDEESDEVCEICAKSMVIKTGRFGKFLSCSAFPECRNTKPFLERVGVECPECRGDLVERQGKMKTGGRSRFYGCSNYPTCTFSVNQRPLTQPCPDCGKLLIASGRRNARCTICDFRGPIPEDQMVDLAS